MGCPELAFFVFIFEFRNWRYHKFLFLFGLSLYPNPALTLTFASAQVCPSPREASPKGTKWERGLIEKFASFALFAQFALKT